MPMNSVRVRRGALHESKLIPAQSVESAESLGESGLRRSAIGLAHQQKSELMVELLGAQLSSITTSTLDRYKGGLGWLPEAALIDSEGVTACNVTISYTHPGHDDLVSVQVWLPLAKFNKRFVGVGGGGWSAGEVRTDLRSALASQGYAVATTNAGYDHDVLGTADPWLMKSPGNLDYPLILNFGHRALHDMAVIAKHIICDAYGSGPDFFYWQGCSTGGR
ncbi:hypothetical protein LA080_011507 [Diaporthe eres]|nr:hypothetical protein LA080_011507 [Diaporthe eres]